MIDLFIVLIVDGRVRHRRLRSLAVAHCSKGDHGALACQGKLVGIIDDLSHLLWRHVVPLAAELALNLDVLVLLHDVLDLRAREQPQRAHHTLLGALAARRQRGGHLDRDDGGNHRSYEVIGEVGT